MLKSTCDFIKNCGVFYVLTVHENAPAGRPFGAIMEHEGKLYLSTGNEKNVYRQIMENPSVQLVAFHPETSRWIRVNGVAKETTSLVLKQKMLEECPVLRRHFASPEAPHFALLEVTVTGTEFF